MTNQQEEYKQFIELASKSGYLTFQAVTFCQERIQSGEDPGVVVVREKFMTEEQVAHIYSSMEKDNDGGNLCRIYTVEPQLQKSKQEEEEEKLLAYLKEKNMISEESLAFCQKEKNRLANMGYQVQLSALLCGTGNLNPNQIQEIYRSILGENLPVALVEGEIPFAENDLPRLHKEKKQKSKPEEASEKIIEQLQNMVEIKEKKKKIKKAKKKAALSQEQESLAEEIAQDVMDDSYNFDEEEPPTELQEKEMAMANSINFTSLVNSLNSLIHVLQQNSPDDGSEIIPKIPQIKPQEEKEDAQEEKEDTSIFTKGKTPLALEKAVKAIQKGTKLQGYHIKDLSLSGVKLETPLSLVDCVIENLDLSDSEFLQDINFEESCFLGKASFKGSVFHKEAQFKKAIFVDGADFTKSQFKGDTRFNTTAFKRFVSFNRSQFEQKVVFTRSSFAKGVKFNEVEFSGAASFNDIYCEHRYYMDNCKFRDETTFSNAQFSDIADFSQSVFQRVVKFKGTHFSRWATFQYVKFEDECHFNGANVVGDMSFGWAKFHGLINLSTLCAERNVNFKNAQINSNARFRIQDAYFGRLFLATSQIENHLESHIEGDFKTARQEYGILKNNFREINEYEQEDWAYLWEKRMERLSIKPQGVRSTLSRFFDWLALDMACGYGTKPLNIFLTSIITLIFFAIFYYSFGSQFTLSQEEASYASVPFLDAIQVSFRTFTNSSIGGWEAKGTSWINYIMMLESFLGFFIMTVLVVTFSRKVIR